jgi:hypothetical protein
LVATLCSCTVLIGPGHGAAARTYLYPDAPTIVLTPRLVTRYDWYEVFVIAHEIGHAVLDTQDEHAANCYAWTNYGRVGITLGWSRTAIRQFLRSVPRAYPPYVECH